VQMPALLTGSYKECRQIRVAKQATWLVIYVL
jgi:hypothetical protein